MPLVKLSIYPEPVEVPADEIPVLRAQGLVEDDDVPAKPAPDPGTPAKPAPKEDVK